jgi:PrtD family type I secretion system ABC transporter
MRAMLRIIAVLLLLAAALSLAHDVARSVAFQTALVPTPLNKIWDKAHPSSLAQVRALLSEHNVAPPGMRLFDTILLLPAWLLAGSLGFLLLLSVAPRRCKQFLSPDEAIEPSVPHPLVVSPKSEMSAALRSCRGALLGIGMFSAIINILALTGSLFMLEIYDRVLPSRSLATLVGLSIVAALLFSSQGFLDLIRTRMLVRIGAALDKALCRRIYAATVRLPLKTGARGDGLQPLRDLDNVRSFLSGLGPTALFDLPWIPLYLTIIFAFHFLLGIVALGGAAFLASLTLLTELLTRSPMQAVTSFVASRQGLAEASRRNAEVVTAMGMTGHMAECWGEANEGYLVNQKSGSDVTGGFGAVSRIVRVMLQSAVLAIGAYLVINQEATAGIIIAGTILTARAFAPVDLAIAHWKSFVAARQSWRRLSNLLSLIPQQTTRMQLPPPNKQLAVENVSVIPPGHDRLVVQDLSFSLKSGQGLGIIGPSASGKSSLARMLVGVWQPARGKIRLDGAALDQWTSEALGSHVGYLPQDVELFGGSIAQNIARFDPAAKPEAIIAAAEAAGVHSLVVGLSNGYDTQIGERGTVLSAGQQQRVALARALYGDPFLVVLDEPNSNLDVEGEAALTKAIFHVRERGGIIVVIAHRPSALAEVDYVLVMNQGRAQTFGPTDEILSKALRPVAPASPPLRLVPDPLGA